MEVVYLKQSLRTAVNALPAIKLTLLLEDVVSSYIIYTGVECSVKHRCLLLLFFYILHRTGEM